MRRIKPAPKAGDIYTVRNPHSYWRGLVQIIEWPALWGFPAFVLDANGPYEPDVVWFFKHWLGRKVDEAEYTKQEK